MRSSVRCGSPSECASARAPTTASGEQQLALPSLCAVGPELERHGRRPRAPRSRSSSAATAESTPPLIATRTRSPLRGGGAERDAGRRGGAERPVQRVGRELAPRGARSPRRRRAPRRSRPGRSGRRRGPSRRRRARRSRRPRPRAARAALGVEGRRATIRPPSIASEIRTRSPQGAPPAVPLKAPSGGRRRAGGVAGVMRKEARRSPAQGRAAAAVSGLRRASASWSWSPGRRR